MHLLSSFHSTVLTQTFAVTNFAKCCSMSNFITWRKAKYVTWLVCGFVCLSVCLFTLYRPQFWSNRFQIFFLDRYPPGIDQVPTWCESGNGIRSKKIPENPKNPYLSSLQKFQKFKSQPKIIRIDSHSLETFIGLISTLKKFLTPKSQRSRSW